ncbi:NAD-dependent epimerase/dehydratase family protein [Nitrosophilus alvini]|uniref:NAD-dependent epimerase/dehydratase family protein n=1 Tax=Nitrosophilus alvini TaxID=2714855 RepID=UPI001909795B|nr:NAD(P)-dependent oxidoreductase [Nitrosophilus alvini]
MKILVTGATGFVGKHLSKKLIEYHDVYAIVREGSDISQLDNKIKIFRYSGKISDLLVFFKDQKFDGVVHLASMFLSEHKPTDIKNLIYSNILFGTELLEASKQTKVKWFINTGTFWQNFNNEEYNPVNLYAATKEAFQKIAKYYTETSNMIFTTIKLNDTFGPNDTRKKIFSLWQKIAESGDTIDMSPGEQIIDISYIEDVVEAYLKLIELLNSNESCELNEKEFVVTNSKKVSLKELAKIFEEVTGTKLGINWGGRNYRKREVMVPYNLGQSVPGWNQKYKLKEAIKKTLRKK